MKKRNITYDKKKRILECHDDIWVSEFITRKEYEKWKKGIYMLACGLGRGKTRFALKEYCKFWREKYKKKKGCRDLKILYLCNRSALKTSIKKQAEKYGVNDIIEIMNYQKMQDEIRRKPKGDDWCGLSKYDAVLCDEAHYFISDSFNKFTETSLEELITMSKSMPVIFITATHDEILSYLDKYYKKSVKKIYKLKTNYSHIKNICFYDKKELYDLLEAIIDQTPTNKAEADKADSEGNLERAIYFCNSLNQQTLICKRYLEKNKQSYYNKSKLQFMMFQQSIQNQKKKDKSIQLKKIIPLKEAIPSKKAIPRFVANRQDDMLECDTTSGSYIIPKDRRLLVSTQCLDNGIDIIDPSVKHIVTDLTDLISVIQCLGRKRADLDENGDVIENCNFYFQNHQENTFGYQAYMTRKAIEQAELFIDEDNGEEKWFDKYGRERKLNNKLFYVDWNKKKNRIEVKLNRLYYEKLQWDKLFFEKIRSGKTTYKEEILNKLGISEESEKIKDVGEIIKSLENTELIKKARKETKKILRRYSTSKREMNANKQEKFINEMYRLNKHFENASGGKLKQISAINEWLKNQEYPYEIKRKRHAVKDGHQPTYWIVEEVKPKSE